MTYKVVFEERYDSVWIDDYFSNNGEGFSYDDALYILRDLIRRGLDGVPIRNVKIVRMP